MMLPKPRNRLGVNWGAQALNLQELKMTDQISG